MRYLTEHVKFCWQFGLTHCIGYKISIKYHFFVTWIKQTLTLKQWTLQEDVFWASPKGKIVGSSKLAFWHIASTVKLKSSTASGHSFLPHVTYFVSIPLHNPPLLLGQGGSHNLLANRRPLILLDPKLQVQLLIFDQLDHWPIVEDA